MIETTDYTRTIESRWSMWFLRWNVGRRFHTTALVGCAWDRVLVGRKFRYRITMKFRKIDPTDPWINAKFPPMGIWSIFKLLFLLQFVKAVKDD